MRLRKLILICDLVFASVFILDSDRSFFISIHSEKANFLLFPHVQTIELIVRSDNNILQISIRLYGTCTKNSRRKKEELAVFPMKLNGIVRVKSIVEIIKINPFCKGQMFHIFYWSRTFLIFLPLYTATMNTIRRQKKYHPNYIVSKMIDIKCH